VITASDMRAMRKAIEHLEGLERRPRELRRCFVPRDAVVRLAAEIANQGGRVTSIDTSRDNGDGLVGLMAAGWLHWFPAPRGWELDSELLSAFAHEVMA
jgi:hypothetical protein